MPYYSQNSDITWESCLLRKWLNSTFIRDAFSAEEQQAILLSDIDNHAEQGFDKSISGGKDTQDKLFLLSYSEMKQFLDNPDFRRCKATAYAKAQGAENKNDYCIWWLRSPGYGLSFATYVNSNGEIGYNYVNSKTISIRPAIWLNLNSSIF